MWRSSSWIERAMSYTFPLPTPQGPGPPLGSHRHPRHFCQPICIGFSRATPTCCHPNPLTPRTHVSQLLWGCRGQCCPGPGRPQGHCFGAWRVPPPPGSPPLALPPQVEWILSLPPAQAGGIGSGLGKKQTTKGHFPGVLLFAQPWSPSHSPECREPSFSVSVPVTQPLPYLATVPDSRIESSQTTARERARVCTCARVCVCVCVCVHRQGEGPRCMV